MSDDSRLKITEAEWEVMLSVWEADAQTPAEIIARVQPLRGRSHRTVRTLLARLVDKGAVVAEVKGSQRCYSAAVTRDECVRAAAESFSERFFGGNLKSLVMHFVEDETLSDQDIAELKQRLEAITDRPTVGEKPEQVTKQKGGKRK